MAVKLTDRASIPAVIKEMTIEEKGLMVNGGSHYGSRAIERLGIPAALFIDAGGGVNLRQYLADLRSKGEMKLENESVTFGSLSQLAFILDHVDDQQELNDEEREVLNRFLTWLKQTKVPSGDLPSCFPVNSLLASTWDGDVILSVARQVGREASAFGVDMLLGTTCINVQRDPRGGRGFECYSEDPYLIAELAPNYPRGVQEQGVCADVKHFAVNNQETNRKTVSVVISERAIREIYLPGFRACVEKGGVKNIMTSYNWINGVAASQNKWLLEDVLRGEWGFDGFVVSDWGGVYDRVRSIQAGNDLCMPRLKKQPFPEAVANGEITEAELDKAIERFLNVLVDMPVMKGRKFTDIDSEAAKKVAYDAAAAGIIMLKNENGALPLAKTARVSFYGKWSERFLESGIGSGRVHTNKTSSLIGATKALIGEENVLFEAVCANTDAVVVTVAAHGQEGADREDLKLPADEAAVLNRAIADAKTVGARVVLILNVAGPVELEEYLADVDAVFCVYFPGQEGAHAMSDMLFGDLNPCGKLAQTFPKHEYDIPSYGNFPGENNAVYYGEGIYLGYRHYDLRHIEPRFPFGFGLSYTDFELSELRLSKDEYFCEKQEPVTVTVRVKNTGKMAGAEVVQLYLRDVQSTQPKPVKELKGFCKVFLQPGESKDVCLTVDREKLCSYDEELHAWVCEPGMFEILIGTSAADIVLKAPLRVRCRNPYGYGRKTYYSVLAKDPRAVKAIVSHLPSADILTEDDIVRQTAYIDAVFTWEMAFKKYIVPKLPQYSEQQLTALLDEICAALSEIDITDAENRYRESEIF